MREGLVFLKCPEGVQRRVTLDVIIIIMTQMVWEIIVSLTLVNVLSVTRDRSFKISSIRRGVIFSGQMSSKIKGTKIIDKTS